MLLTPALTCYLIAAVMAAINKRPFTLFVLLGQLLHGIAILQHWLEIGHGPYLGLYDSLSSNLWLQLFLLSILSSLNKDLFKAYATGLLLALPFVLWLLTVEPESHKLPPTYATNWFYLHLFAGKLAYALLFIAITLSVYQLRTRQTAIKSVQQIMLLAFICYSLLLFAGGNWAYLAWGKYWDWNPLEIWSLLSWFGFGLYFHRPGISGYKWLPGQTGIVIIIYIFAILGFYGIPFISYTTHQGLI